MARLQILELPEGEGDRRPPFVLVIDEYGPRRYVMGAGQSGEPRSEFEGVAERIGARAVLTFTERIEIPANEVTAEFRASLRDTVGDVYEAARSSLSEPDAVGHELLERAEGAEEKLKKFTAEQTKRDRRLMNDVTDALGLDRLPNWSAIINEAKSLRDGGHRFSAQGHVYVYPLRCAECGMDANAWRERTDRRTCAEMMTKRDG